MKFHSSKSITALLLATIVSSSFSQMSVWIKKDFVDKYRRRLTFDGEFTVQHAKPAVNQIADDGDIHVVTTCQEIGLPMVSEVMNARLVPDCVHLLQSSQGSDTKIPFSGVWRLWMEHPGASQHQFGDNVIHGPATNPDHVFEIHPLTKVGEFDLLGTIKRIKDQNSEYGYHPATDFVPYFKSQKFSVVTDGDFVKITGPKARYNYVEFKFKKLTEEIFEVEDGYFIYASILDHNDQVLERKVRLGFVNGTAIADEVKQSSLDHIAEVMATTRISLALVDYRATHAKSANWSLPYELVVLGSTGDL
jgi:hypothetical protein